jgi:hypothetical protein
VDCFPEWMRPAQRRFWLERSEAAIRADERLRSGEAADEEVYDLVLTATGDKKLASAVAAERLRATLRRRSRDNFDL